EKCTRVKGIEQKFDGPVFNEFVLEFNKPYKDVALSLKKAGILGGLGLAPDYPEIGNCALFCVTDKHSKEEIERLADALDTAM
ncbi:MAG: glycine dehydrogenase, partial [Candidatus Aminicenantes bacterium]|nr:glycine dehydrogenase [Candidatus Aminicenantes bacterium]